jgi:hypothetical protein
LIFSLRLSRRIGAAIPSAPAAAAASAYATICL